MDIEEKIFRINELINQRIINEDRLLAERSSVFLLSSSILFAGFAMLIDKCELLTIIIPCIGIVLSVISWSVSWGMIRELNLWLAMSKRIEQEEDAFKELKERERVPHSAWDYWWMGKSKYMTKKKYPLYMKLPAISRWEKCLPFGILQAWHMYRFYVPGAFFVIWVTSLVWVLL